MKLQKILPGLLVFVGGGFGVSVQQGVYRSLSSLGYGIFIYPLINTLGAFALGFLAAFLKKKGNHTLVEDRWQELVFSALGTGFLGGFTSYSAFAMGAVNIANTGGSLASLGYLALVTLLGFLAVWLGFLSGEKL